MDPIDSFVSRMSQEDLAVDHLYMKMNEEKMEKLKTKVKKLSDYVLSATGCSKKDIEIFLRPGVNPQPPNKKLQDMEKSWVDAEDVMREYKNAHVAEILIAEFAEVLIKEEVAPEKLDGIREKVKEYRSNCYNNHNVPENLRNLRHGL